MAIDISKNLRHCQEENDKLNNITKLHPLLVGDFEPDVRPFEWPEKPAKDRGPYPMQPNLFEDETYDETNDFDW